MGTDTLGPEGSNSLATQPPPGMVAAPAAPPADLGSAIIGAIDRGNFDVATLERLQAIYERDAAWRAEREFNSALADFQAKCPSVRKTKSSKDVKDAGTAFAYTYAALDDICDTVRPHLHALGLSFTFEGAAAKDGLMSVVCVLRHKNGHSIRAVFPVPIDKSGRMNDIQKYGASLTYAKRYALSQVLGIATTEDTDGRTPGEEPETVGPGQLRALEEMLVAIDASPDSRRRFLAKYQIETLDRMHVAVFPLALADLKAIAGKKGVRP